jgi:hypothetical protein
LETPEVLADNIDTQPTFQMIDNQLYVAYPVRFYIAMSAKKLAQKTDQNFKVPKIDLSLYFNVALD